MNNPVQLEVHVIGADEGESIVLRLPNDEWGVVDCCASSLKDQSSNPTLLFLESRNVQRLAFICMTHPHADHFRGMSQLLSKYLVDFFLLPGAMTGEELRLILEHESFDAMKAGARERQENVSELKNIFRQVKIQKTANGRPMIPKKACTGTILYPSPIDQTAKLQVTALSPSTRQAIRYESKLKDCFDSNGRLVSKLKPSDHNVISIALLVVFGKTRVVLSGDVEKGGWSDLLEEFEPAQLSCHAVKISHHGSSNGYCSHLWATFARERNPISVLTPFNRHRLPRREALQHIRPFVSRISCTCLSGLDEKEVRVPLSVNEPAASRAALRQIMGARNKPKPAHGRCAFVFDDEGNCVSADFDGEAGDIAPEWHV